MTSKYTCKTCKNIGCDLHADNPGNINEDTGDTYNHFHWYYTIIEKKGCASHSSFQSERDEVLGDLLEIFDDDTNYNGWFVRETLIEKLRQAGEP